MATINKGKLYKSLLGLGLGSALALGGSFLIAPQEGLEHTTYKDIAGVITSCYGHTDGTLKLGVTYTQQECDSQLAKDLVKHDNEMMRAVKVPFISDYEHSAFLSFCYNIGTNACTNSTAFKRLNEGDHISACKQIVKWVYVNSKDCRKAENNCSGIVTRRDKEMRWCLNDLTSQELKEIEDAKNYKE